MLKATKSAWIERVFAIYNRNLLKRRFHSLRARGLEHLRAADGPTIVLANHSSWWDGLVAFEIFRRAGTDAFVLMDEANLRKYPFFRRLGAFSIDRSNPKKALESFAYAAELAADKRTRSFLIFPQGRIVPATCPIVFEAGVVRLLERLTPCRVVTLALAYSFGSEFKPEIFAGAGRARQFLAPPGKSVLADLETDLENELDEIRRSVASGTAGDFRDLLARER
jgi:1-acyl-sn-glycerol-3-phosphate acyltransferase